MIAMPRYIDADILEDSLGIEDEDIIFKEILRGAPTVDAVPVVRCGECKLHGSCTFEETFITAGLAESHRYCGAGERKDGEK